MSVQITLLVKAGKSRLRRITPLLENWWHPQHMQTATDVRRGPSSYFTWALIVGLAGSQLLGAANITRDSVVGQHVFDVVQFLTMTCLVVVMAHVGQEMELRKTTLRSLVRDYGVATGNAALPWLLSAATLLLIVPVESWDSATVIGALLVGRFAAPTSAGVLLTLLKKAGLEQTWVYAKARDLATLDDIETILLMVLLQAVLVGPRWQLAVVAASAGIVIAVFIRWGVRKDDDGIRLRRPLRLPSTAPWLLLYGVVIAAAASLIHAASLAVDASLPIHIEVLLPAFVLGAMLEKRPEEQPTVCANASTGGHTHERPGSRISDEDKVNTITLAFMFLAGLSIPPLSLALGSQLSLAKLIALAAVLLVLGNIGKMVPLFFYRDEAPWAERLALSIGMWPRGEVGAGVLLVALSYNLMPEMIAPAALALTLNMATTPWVVRLVQHITNHQTVFNNIAAGWVSK